MTNHIQKQMLYVFLAAIAILLLAADASAQSEGNTQSVYALTLSREVYTLSRVNLVDGSSTPIFSIASTSSSRFADVVPSDEIAAARTQFQNSGETPDFIESFLNSQLDVSVESISVAPDNQQVALNIKYQNCTSFQNYVCFGVYQIVLLTGETGEITPIFSLGFHAAQYIPGQFPELVRDVQINEIRWTPDQQALVASLSDEQIRRNGVDDPLIVIPLVGGARPFQVGQASTWTIAPNSRQIAGISRNIREITDTLILINFDLATEQVSQSSYPLGTYVTYLPFGVAYVNQSIVFDINSDAALLEGGGGLAIFNPERKNPLTLTSLNIGGYDEIRSTPDGQAAVIQSSDGSLWRATISNDTMSAELVTRAPIVSWRFGPGGEILAQPANSAEFQIIDPEGAIEGQFSLLEEASITNAEVLDVDW